MRDHTPETSLPHLPAGTYDSCLVTKLEHYLDMTPEERGMLSTLEKTEQPVASGDEVFIGGEPNRHLFVVKHGWLYAHTYLPDGGRLVVRIYNAGDIVGLSSLAFDAHVVNLRAASDACLCPFPRNRLDQVIRSTPRIAALLFTLAAREETILIDSLRAASRMRPDARLAQLLLNLHARLKITNTTMRRSFRLPLTQTDIGDAVGLTNVTVSRTLSQMADQGWIKRREGAITLLDIDTLAKLCDFQNRHESIDTSWF